MRGWLVGLCRNQKVRILGDSFFFDVDHLKKKVYIEFVTKMFWFHVLAFWPRSI